MFADREIWRDREKKFAEITESEISFKCLQLQRVYSNNVIT